MRYDATSHQDCKISRTEHNSFDIVYALRRHQSTLRVVCSRSTGYVDVVYLSSVVVGSSFARLRYTYFMFCELHENTVWAEVHNFVLFKLGKLHKCGKNF